MNMMWLALLAGLGVILLIAGGIMWDESSEKSYHKLNPRLQRLAKIVLVLGLAHVMPLVIGLWIKAIGG